VLLFTVTRVPAAAAIYVSSVKMFPSNLSTSPIRKYDAMAFLKNCRTHHIVQYTIDNKILNYDLTVMYCVILVDVTFSA
jgi:hypothetical protein